MRIALQPVRLPGDPGLFGMRPDGEALLGGQLPGEVLHRFAYEMEQSDQGERIRQCERWREAENGVQ